MRAAPLLNVVLNIVKVQAPRELLLGVAWIVKMLVSGCGTKTGFAVSLFVFSPRVGFSVLVPSFGPQYPSRASVATKVVQLLSSADTKPHVNSLVSWCRWPFASSNALYNYF